MNNTISHATRLATLALLPAVLLVSACKPDDDKIPTPAVTSAPVVAPAPPVAVAPRNPVASTVVPASDLRGQVIAIDPIVQHDKATGAGVAVGGLLGGVLGHQVGGGNGKKAATVAGAVGGAVLGNEVEKKHSEHVSGYRVSVRTETGSTRQFERTSVNDLAVGSTVRIVEGRVQPA